MRIIILLIYLFYGYSLNAENNSTCIEKLEQLKKLKSQEASVFEKTASYIFSSSISSFVNSEDEQIVKQKIRVLEMELKSCKE